MLSSPISDLLTYPVRHHPYARHRVGKRAAGLQTKMCWSLGGRNRACETGVRVIRRVPLPGPQAGRGAPNRGRADPKVARAQKPVTTAARRDAVRFDTPLAGNAGVSAILPTRTAGVAGMRQRGNVGDAAVRRCRIAGRADRRQPGNASLSGLTDDRKPRQPRGSRRTARPALPRSGVSARGGMRTISVINQKGGSGKTTTTVNLGATLAEAGKRVLLIDLDPQYSTTQWLAAHDVGRGVFDLFAEPEATCPGRPRPPDRDGEPVARRFVGVAGGGGEGVVLRTRGRDHPPSETRRPRPGRLRLRPHRLPPTLGVLTVNALTAVAEVLVPVECHVMGLQGLAQILQTIDRVRKRLNPDVRVAGILACRLDQRTNHGPEIVAKLRGRFPETYTTVVRENIRLAECRRWASRSPHTPRPAAGPRTTGRSPLKSSHKKGRGHMARPRTSKSTIRNDPVRVGHPDGPVRPPAFATTGGCRPAPSPPPAPAPANEVDVPAVTDRDRPPAVPAAAADRSKLTVHLDGDVVNRVKNAAYWNPRLTIARIAERGIRLALKESRRRTAGRTRSGRPTSSAGGRSSDPPDSGSHRCQNQDRRPVRDCRAGRDGASAGSCFRSRGFVPSLAGRPSARAFGRRSRGGVRAFGRRNGM